MPTIIYDAQTISYVTANFANIEITNLSLLGVGEFPLSITPNGGETEAQFWTRAIEEVNVVWRQQAPWYAMDFSFGAPTPNGANTELVPVAGFNTGNTILDQIGITLIDNTGGVPPPLAVGGAYRFRAFDFSDLVSSSTYNWQQLERQNQL